jgi:hypothetical protein
MLLLKYWLKKLNGEREELSLKIYHLLGLIPFIMILGFAGWANHIEPYVLGMPFLLFWTVLWTVLTSPIMWIIFKLDAANKGDIT